MPQEGLTFMREDEKNLPDWQKKIQNTFIAIINKTNDLILNLTPENVTQHSRIE